VLSYILYLPPTFLTATSNSAKEQGSAEKDVTTDVLTLLPWDKIRAFVFYIVLYNV
jgi:hypothetical protein